MPEARSGRKLADAAPPIGVRFTASEMLKRVQIAPKLAKTEMHQAEAHIFLRQQAIRLIARDPV